MRYYIFTPLNISLFKSQKLSPYLTGCKHSAPCGNLKIKRLAFFDAT